MLTVPPKLGPAQRPDKLQPGCKTLLRAIAFSNVSSQSTFNPLRTKLNGWVAVYIIEPTFTPMLFRNGEISDTSR